MSEPGDFQGAVVTTYPGRQPPVNGLGTDPTFGRYLCGASALVPYFRYDCLFLDWVDWLAQGLYLPRISVA